MSPPASSRPPPAGEILLGEPTLELIRQAVEVEPVEPLTLKGKAEPVPAFRLLAVAGEGERRLRTPVGELADAGYTAAAACLADELQALTVHLRYPVKHRRVWRSTNLLERSLGEVLAAAHELDLFTRP
jgi:hypothetical protein